ncbi:MAG: bis(5'-nucleosyl)-tetraphosphatase (symmetrical) YqeK [Eubacteriales bacterium]|nr:bis(5'-nucleosyl)-tetraphosphatase (symmetrical) YqeK [Eubacteriales bacterium]
MDCNSKQLIKFLKKHIDHKRIKHSVNTAREAVMLAKRYGVDEQKAYIAGMTHDVAKGKCRFGLNKLAKEYNVIIDEFEISNPELTHGKLGAEIVSRQLGIRDKEILSAIRWHTTGRADMSMLEKIIYIADIIEPGRKFKGIGEIKKLAYEDIDAAMISALEQVMKFVQSRGFALHSKSIEAYQYLKEREEKKKLGI